MCKNSSTREQLVQLFQVFSDHLSIGISTDTVGEKDLVGSFKIALGRHQVEVENTLRFIDRNEKSSLEALLKQLDSFKNYKIWMANGRCENGLTFRGIKALHNFLQSLISLNTLTPDQELIASWSTVIDEEFIRAEFIPLFSKITAIWNFMESSIRSYMHIYREDGQNDVLEKIKVSVPVRMSNRSFSKPKPENDTVSAWIDTQAALVMDGIDLEAIKKESARSFIQSSKVKVTGPIKPVKLTAAAVLREESILKRKLAKEKQNFDDQIKTSAFKSGDEEERIRKSKLKLLVQLAKEQSVQSRHKIAEEKNKQVLDLKRQSEKLLCEKELEKYEAALNTHNLVNQISSSRQNAKSATEAIKSEKLLRAKDFALQLEEQMKQKREREAEERKRLLERIKEFKLDQQVSKLSQREDRDLAILSLKELRATLSKLKEQEKQESEMRRLKIIEMRKQDNQKIASKIQFIEAYRGELAKKQSEVRSRSDSHSIASFLSNTARQDVSEVEKLRKKLELLRIKNGKIPQIQSQ